MTITTDKLDGKKLIMKEYSLRSVNNDEKLLQLTRNKLTTYL